MKNWLIIGSTAAYHWFPDHREPSDIDVLTPAKISGNHSTLCVVDAQWHTAAQYLIDLNSNPVFMDPDLLFTLKVSHAHWDVKFNKTLYDISFLKNHGAKLHTEAYQKLLPVWDAVHGKKFVNLNQPVERFFSDAVTREYNHERLHELVAFYDRPLHEQIRPDRGSAWCSKELFAGLSPEDQAKTALEEIMAVAIERGRLSTSSKRSEVLRAVHQSHHRLITSMTAGWFALYLILNARELLSDLRLTWEPVLLRALERLKNE